MTLTELRLACARAGVRVSAEQGQLRNMLERVENVAAAIGTGG